MNKYVILFIVLIGFVGCNPFKQKDTLNFEKRGGLRTEKNVQIGFSEISKKILVPHCLRCHSKYMSYSRVFKEKDLILKTVLNGSMPKNRPSLDLNLKNLLSDWIATGAKRDVELKKPANPSKVLVGLSEKMKNLFKLHNQNHPVLDKEVRLELTNTGTPLNLNFSDNRIAQLQYSISETKKVLSRIDFTENTCKPNLKPKACLFAAHYKHYAKKVVWLKHPNQKKIGKKIEYSSKEENPEDLNFVEIVEDDYLGAQIGIISPKLDYKAKDYIICDDWDWLKNEKVNIKAWSVELMVSNTETRVNENRQVGAIYNFELTPFDKNIYRFMPGKFLDSFFGRSSISYLNGEAGSFTYSEGDNDCTVSFKLDLSPLIMSVTTQDISDYIFKPFYENQDNSFLFHGNSSFNREIQDAVEGVVR